MASSEADARSVINACLESGSQEAWTSFVRLFQPLIASAILRIVRRDGQVSPAIADDLIQETYLRLCNHGCKALREFEYRHEQAIFGFIKVVAASVAMDYVRSRTTQKRAAESQLENDEVLTPVSDPAADIHTSIQMSEISALVDRIAQSERDRTVFWLYYRHGYTARDIAGIPNIELTAKGVESLILRLTRTLRSHMNPALLQRPGEGISPSSTVGEIR
jgi:RNA polymerase sigma-70 factor (ECF subfamily)